MRPIREQFENPCRKDTRGSVENTRIADEYSRQKGIVNPGYMQEDDSTTSPETGLELCMPNNFQCMETMCDNRFCPYAINYMGTGHPAHANILGQCRTGGYPGSKEEYYTTEQQNPAQFSQHSLQKPNSHSFTSSIEEQHSIASNHHSMPQPSSRSLAFNIVSPDRPPGSDLLYTKVNDKERLASLYRIPAPIVSENPYEIMGMYDNYFRGRETCATADTGIHRDSCMNANTFHQPHHGSRLFTKIATHSRDNSKSQDALDYSTESYVSGHPRTRSLFSDRAVPGLEACTSCLHSELECQRLVAAARKGMLPMVPRRLSEVEKRMIRPGSIFIYSEEASAIKRWTDSRAWSPSRVLGPFLTYKEIEGQLYKKTFTFRSSWTSPELTEGEWDRAIKKNTTTFHIVAYSLGDWEKSGNCCKYFGRTSTLEESPVNHLVCGEDQGNYTSDIDAYVKNGGVYANREGTEDCASTHVQRSPIYYSNMENREESQVNYSSAFMQKNHLYYSNMENREESQANHFSYTNLNYNRGNTNEESTGTYEHKDPSYFNDNSRGSSTSHFNNNSRDNSIPYLNSSGGSLCLKAPTYRVDVDLSIGGPHEISEEEPSTGQLAGEDDLASTRDSSIVNSEEEAPGPSLNTEISDTVIRGLDAGY